MTSAIRHAKPLLQHNWRSGAPAARPKRQEQTLDGHLHQTLTLRDFRHRHVKLVRIHLYPLQSHPQKPSSSQFVSRHEQRVPLLGAGKWQNGCACARLFEHLHPRTKKSTSCDLTAAVKSLRHDPAHPSAIPGLQRTSRNCSAGAAGRGISRCICNLAKAMLSEVHYTERSLSESTLEAATFAVDAVAKPLSCDLKRCLQPVGL